MYSLASFSVSDMTKCAMEFRKQGAWASSSQPDCWLQRNLREC